MSDIARLIGRSGELKRALLDFTHTPPYNDYLRDALQEKFGPVVVGDEHEVGNFFDHFLLQRRLPDGRTLVDHFVAAHPDLPPDERAMLLGWQDVVEGIFAVVRRERDALEVVNLIDDLTYRVRSNMGARALAPMKPGTFLITRLVPVEDEWLLSGYSHLLPASEQREAFAAAQKVALQQPKLAFRNPRKLEQAWELQRRQRRDFITFFGSDTVVLPGQQLNERLQAYYHFQMHEVRNAEGQSVAEQAREKYGVVPEPPSADLDRDLTERETVGVIFDEVEGLNFFPDFGIVDETFATPELVKDRHHREAVLGYLESPGIHPFPLRRLAERNPENASRLFRRLLRQRDFDWERDGEALLRRYKAGFFEQPAVPGVVPIDESFVRSLLAGTRGTGTRAVRGQGRRSRNRGKKAKR